jgi:prepilin-type N-terminal cleavage/methylation domain-containing protein
MARTGPDRRSKRARRQGFTVLEVAIALLIVSTVLVSLTGAFLNTAQAVQSAKGVSRATVFLQSVMDGLEAQSYDALPSFHGNRIFNRDTQQVSNWSVDLAVFPAGIDLEQLDATLVDLRTGRVLARISTLRSRR